MAAAHHPRLPDWEQRLADFIAANSERAFAWGEWDCILFACASAHAITGIDKAAEYRGRYSNQTGARAVLRDPGKGTLLKTIDHHFERVPVGRAMRGDLIWRDGCVGVCLGANAAFLSVPELLDEHDAPRLGNFVLLPRPLWQKAWRV